MKVPIPHPEARARIEGMERIVKVQRDAGMPPTLPSDDIDWLLAEVNQMYPDRKTVQTSAPDLSRFDDLYTMG